MNEAQLHSLPIPSLVVRKLISAISISNSSFGIYISGSSNFPHLFIYVQTGRNAKCTSNAEGTLKFSAHLGLMRGNFEEHDGSSCILDEIQVIETVEEGHQRVRMRAIFA